MRQVLLGIPFYKNAHLVEPLIRSIVRSRIDKSKYDLSILFVVDSPDDAELVERLTAACREVQAAFPVELVINGENLGFVASANRIIAKAAERAADVILINSDALLFEDTLEEMLEVSTLDPMIGFVSPRTNNTTICTFPLPGADTADPFKLHDDFRALAPRLPRMTYTPTVVGFCMLIRGNIVRAFGGFDPIFSPGYNEENDLVMRANRYGYRAVVANRAFAYHEGGASFALVDKAREQLEKEHGAILAQRHPDYYPSVERYVKSAEHRAFGLVAQLAPGARPRVAFDFSSLAAKRNGTTEHGTQVLRAFAKLYGAKYQISVICDQSIWQFLEFDKIPSLSWSAVDAQDQYAAVVRLSQPFDTQSLKVPAHRGATVIYMMLDAIAYDCLYMRPAQLAALWHFVMEHSDAILYNSSFSKDQFARRFRSGEKVRHAVSMPSTDLEDYKSVYAGRIAQGDYLLLVGNNYAHKAIRETVHAIRAKLPALELRVLGAAMPELPQLISFESGLLHDSAVQELFAGAMAIVFPSHYEGFGLPVMHALAHQKLVFVRDLPVYDEIKARVAVPDGIRVFRTDEELIEFLSKGEFAWRERSRNVSDVGWDRAARELETEIGAVIRAATVATINARLESLDHLDASLTATETHRREIDAMTQAWGRERSVFEHERVVSAGRAHEHSQKLSQELAGVREELASMRNSTSWRLTSPIRKFKSAMNRIFDSS